MDSLATMLHETCETGLWENSDGSARQVSPPPQSLHIDFTKPLYT
jgi:hypothetical protein